MSEFDELWELMLTRDQVRAVVGAIEALLEGENADAFSDDETAGLRRLQSQLACDLDDDKE